MRIYYWQRMTTAEIADVAATHAVALLPLAAIEQHGAHLPLDTDVVVGEAIVTHALGEIESGRADDSVSVIVLPTQSMGASVEHANFSGTLTLSSETAMATIEALGQSVRQAGIERLVVFNSHGGNTAVLDAAALNLRAYHGLHVIKATYFRFGTPDAVDDFDELAQDLHAGALETSMMLHIAPDAVRRDHIPPSTRTKHAPASQWVAPEGRAAYAWLAEDFGDDGIAGEPARADGDIGRQLVAYFGGCLAAVIRETADLQLPR
ncbi:creatininase family protein [Salinisphaera sp. USBA-960]|nr:creatininase family protein [Salifodinibacter halophilus]